MNKYFINLNSCPDRIKYFDNSWNRYEAISRDLVSDSTSKKMISYYNVKPEYHMGKCGCFCSHTNLLKMIVDNKLNKVIVCEDDAELMHEIPSDLGDGFVYLGGFFLNKKKTDGEYKLPHNSVEGLNDLSDKDFTVAMTMSYYIGTWEVAEEILKEINSLKRWRAIDILYINCKFEKKYFYPAIFRERRIESTIRKNKKKFSNEYYMLN